MDAHELLCGYIPNRSVLHHDITTDVEVVHGDPIQHESGVRFANTTPGDTTYTVTLRLAAA